MESVFSSTKIDYMHSVAIPFSKTSITIAAEVNEETASCVLTYGVDLNDLDNVTTLTTCSTPIHNLGQTTYFQFMLTSGDDKKEAVYNAMVARLGKPEITEQPINMNSNATTDVTFSVRSNAGISLTGQEYTLEYQWLVKAGAAFTEISQATNAKLHISWIHVSQNQTQIQCRYNSLPLKFDASK